MFKKRNYRKRVVRKSRRVVSRRKSSVGVAVKKYVKRAIHANVENKRALYNASFSVGNIGNSSTLYARPLTPAAGFLTINSGTGQGDKIGNRCKTMKAMLRYTLFPLGYDAVSNPLPIPQEVLIIIGYAKQTPCTIPTGVQVGSLFQNGSASSPPQGDLGDLIQPYNHDVWTIKKVIRHKIGNGAVEGTGANFGNQFYNNNDFKLNAYRSINITDIYPKNLIFNDGGNNLQNAGLFIMIESINANGTVAGALNTSVFFDWALDLEFEDA